MFTKFLRNIGIIVIISTMALPVQVYGYSFTDTRATDLELNPYSYMPQAGQGLTQQISADATQLGELNIAPPPVVITSSSGDVYIYEQGQVRARLSVDQKGTDSTTFYIQGAPAYTRDEFDKVTFYNYANNGANVTLTNQTGAIVASEVYRDGTRLWSSGESGKITYTYDDNNQLTGSIDPFGNTTHYEGGKPTYITNSDGTVAGTYNYVGDVLSTYTDQFGNATHFGTDGLRPAYTTNAQGTITQTYYYDNLGNLDYVVNNTTGETTDTQQGYYTAITNTEGSAVAAYNYDDRGYAVSQTKFSLDGIVSGWTVYDDFGRPTAVYNAQGSLVQSYNYNKYGFVASTNSFGAVDTLTNTPTLTGITLFDQFGRPDEVTNQSGVTVQRYEYNAKGILDRTKSYGDYINGTSGDQAMTGFTIYDDIGRALYAYNDKGDVVQEYGYNAQGFMEYTLSIGEGGVVTGKTNYDYYNRPTIALNETGSTLQRYIYGDDGFLDLTQSIGEDGTTVTGTSVFDATGRPTDVYNGQNKLVQQYVYNSRGFLDITKSLGLPTDLAGVVITEAEKDLLHALEATGTYDFGDYSSATLVAKAWEALSSNDLDAVKAYTLKCIEMYRGDALNQQSALAGLPESGSQEAFNQWALNDVGASYFILGEALQNNGQNDLAVIAYRVVAAELSYSQAWDPGAGASGAHWQVAAGSTEKLTAMGILNPVYTGYTQYNAYGRPDSAYQISETGVTMLSQTFDYRKRDENGNVMLDESGNEIMSGFMQRTVSYGAEKIEIDENGTIIKGPQAVTGYTTYNAYGRQDASFNDFGDRVQNYNYSANGFLQSTQSLGEGGAITGSTTFDIYGRQMASYNSSGAVTQEYEYALRGTDGEKIITNGSEIDTGFLQRTISYGEDQTMTGYTNYSAFSRPTETFNAYGILQQRSNYINIAGENDGFLHSTISLSQPDADGKQIAIGATYYNEYGRPEYATQGSEDVPVLLANGSQNPEAPVVQVFDYTVNVADPETGVVTVENTGFLQRTWSQDREGNPTSVVTYDREGRQDASYNIMDVAAGTVFSHTAADLQYQGVKVQGFEYSGQGFIAQTVSMGREGQITGYTTFNNYGQQDKSYNQSMDEATGMGLVQTYDYVKGFLVKTTSYGEAMSYTEKDANGRFIDETGNVVYDPLNPSQALNVTAVKNEDGEIVSVTVNTKTGYTEYDLYQRPDAAYNTFVRGTDANGNAIYETVQVYDYCSYDARGNVVIINSETGDKVTYIASEHRLGVWNEAQQRYDYLLGADGNVVFANVELDNDGNIIDYATNPAGTMTVFNTFEDGFLSRTWNKGRVDEATGEQVTTGYTVYNGAGRPTEAYTYYQDTTGVGSSLAQIFTYKDGFLDNTVSLGQEVTQSRAAELEAQAENPDATIDYKGKIYATTGTTYYDGYGRQENSVNEYGETVQTYQYSGQGFLEYTFSVGKNGAVTGHTEFDKFGRQLAAYNSSSDFSSDQGLVQTFDYIINGRESGFFVTATSYGTDKVITGKTIYDAYNRPQEALNAEGTAVQNYVYEKGFLKQTQSLNRDGNVDSTTTYNEFGRPDAVNNFANNIVQSFVYDRGFLTQTLSYGAGGTANITGTTTYDDAGRQLASYNSEGGLSQTYEYNQQGFVARTNNYAANEQFSGFTVYDNYGRPTDVYNYAGDTTTGTGCVQVYQYDAKGFVWRTVSLGNDGAITGETYFDEHGRPDEVYNAEGNLVMTYVYDGSNAYILPGAGWANFCTANPTIGGGYTGDVSDNWTFKVTQVIGSGNVGEGTIVIEVRDRNNALINTLNFGEGYTAGTSLDVGYGISLSMDQGKLVTNNTFNLEMTAGIVEKSIGQPSSWSIMQVAAPQLTGAYTGAAGEWVFSINQNGVIGVTEGLQLTVFKQGSAEMPQAINIGAGYNGEAIELGDGMQLVLGAGAVAAGASFTATFGEVSAITVGSWSVSPVVLPTFSGTYAGTSNETWTFAVSGAGTIGQTAGLEIIVRDGTGTEIARLDVGAGYVAGTELEISQGVKVAFSAGNVLASDNFSANLTYSQSASLSTPASWNQNSTATPIISAQYNGGDAFYQVTVNKDGVIGVTEGLKLLIKNLQTNHVDEIDIGAGYVVGDNISITTSEGTATIGVNGGMLHANDTFSFNLKDFNSSSYTDHPVWTNASTANITVNGNYGGATDDIWIGQIVTDVSVYNNGFQYNFKLKVTDRSGNVIGYYDTGLSCIRPTPDMPADQVYADLTSNLSKEIKDGIGITLASGGRIYTGDSFVITLSHRDSVKSIVWDQNSTSMFNLSLSAGGYTGRADQNLVFQVKTGGYVGAGSTTVAVFVKDAAGNLTALTNSSGQAVELNLGSTYSAGTEIAVGDTGIEVSFTGGVLRTGHSFDAAVDITAQSTQIQSSAWQMASAATVNLSGVYNGTGSDKWTFTVNQNGEIGQTEGLMLTVRDTSGAIVAEINIGAGYTAGSEIDLADGVKIALSEGMVSGSDSFTADLSYSMATAVSALSQTPQISALALSGEYTGTTDAEWKFEILQGGTVGQDTIRIRITDQNGAVVNTLDYTGGKILVADGISLSLSEGDVIAGDSANSVITVRSRTEIVTTELVWNNNSTALFNVLGQINSAYFGHKFKFTVDGNSIKVTDVTNAANPIDIAIVALPASALDGNTLDSVLLDVGNTGIKISLSQGTLCQNDSFTVSFGDNVNVTTNPATGEGVLTGTDDGFLDQTISYGDIGADGQQVATGVTMYNAKGQAVETYGAVKVGNNWVANTNALTQLNVYSRDGYVTHSLNFGQLTGWQMGSSPSLSLSGDYTGTHSDQWTFTINKTGEIGVTEGLRLTVSDSSGAVIAVFNIGKADPSDGIIDIAEGMVIEGVNIELGFGTVNAGDSFVVNNNAAGTSEIVRNKGTYLGMTTFDYLGRQSLSYNEYGGMTQAFVYNDQGFMSESINYGLNSEYAGRTVYNDLGRPDVAYNVNGSLTQRYEYNSRGFLTASYAIQGTVGVAGIGYVDVVTGKTTYNEYGRQTGTYQVYQIGTMFTHTGDPNSYAFDPTTGIMTSSENDAIPGHIFVPVLDADGTITGYTDTGVDNDGKIQEYVYDANGFLVNTISYVALVERDSKGDPILDANGNVQFKGWCANTITNFNNYSRPTEIVSAYKIDEDTNAPLVIQNYYYNNGYMYASTSSFKGGANGEFTPVDPSVTYYDGQGRAMSTYNNVTKIPNPADPTNRDADISVEIYKFSQGEVPPMLTEDLRANYYMNGSFAYNGATGFLDAQYTLTAEGGVSGTTYYNMSGRQVASIQTGSITCYLYDDFGFMRATFNVNASVLNTDSDPEAEISFKDWLLTSSIGQALYWTPSQVWINPDGNGRPVTL